MDRFEYLMYKLFILKIIIFSKLFLKFKLNGSRFHLCNSLYKKLELIINELYLYSIKQ